MKIIKKFFIRSRTNTGSLCKQYFHLIPIKGGEGYTLIIHKFVLVEDFNLEYYQDLMPVKKFKDRYLYFEHFGIKLDTLTMALLRINDFLIEKKPDNAFN